MRVQIVGSRKITKKNGKEWVNVCARIFSSRDLCNTTGIRVGDVIQLKINDDVFNAKVSDFITIPSKLVFNKNEKEIIKGGVRIKKSVNIEILNIHKKEVVFNKNKEEFVGILAHLFSDGCITPTNIHFTNTDKEIIEYFKSLIKSCFPLANIDEWKDDNILHIQIDNTETVSIISRFVEIFGRKSITNPHVPDFIKNDILFSKLWLKHVFSDEGWINKHTNKVCIARQIRFENENLIKNLKWKKAGVLKDNFPVIIANLNRQQLKLVPVNNLINDERSMLKKLGIKSNVHLRKRVNLINSKISASFELFMNSSDFINIGLCCSKKQKELLQTQKFNEF